ncbi:MAG: helix-turn-helix transcriptional regulator [Clostridia bacterium]|nr:helix-turn-helix transcriptional regulator [Clostridia bacterium]
MLNDIEKIKLLSITRQTSRHGAVHTHYPHRIILRLSAVMDYIVQGERVRVEPGDVMFLMNSPHYQALYPTSESGESLMINFSGELIDTPSGVLVVRKSAEMHRLICAMYRSWAVQTDVNRCRCMAMLWEVLAIFAEAGETRRSYTERLLDPALEHLEKHIFDPDLRAGQLHRLCGVSDTYFRKLFEERFGLTPKKYILQRRLDQAKAILESGEYGTVAAVAEAVGFEDGLYFGKVYRDRYGKSPRG